MFGSALVLFCLPLVLCSAQDNETYRAAVYEHVPIYKDTFQDTVEANLEVYKQKIVEAANQGVDIVVFPEYGLIGEISLQKDITREKLKQFVPVLYSPFEVAWNPCSEPKKFANSQILETLSCAAKMNSITVVASLITQRQCTSETWSTCPSDQVFLHCTSVAISSSGELLIAVYKRHLVNEAPLDPSPTDGGSWFFLDNTTSIALSSGLDFVFAKEMASLSEEIDIKHFIVTNSLKEQLPFESSMQMFNAFANTECVNVLIANRYEPSVGCLGSGIFSGNIGALNYTYDLAKPGEMVIADVPIYPTNSWTSASTSSLMVPKNLQTTGNASDADAAQLVYTNLPSSAETNQTLKLRYRNDMNDFDFVYLEKNETVAMLSTANDGVLCKLFYAFNPNYDNSTISYVLAMKSGNHKVGSYNLSEDICVVLRCENKDNFSSCGKVPIDPRDTPPITVFRLYGKFLSDLILPLVLGPDMQLLPGDQYEFGTRKNCYRSSVIDKYSISNILCNPEASIALKREREVLAFGFFGRYDLYNKIDNIL